MENETWILRELRRRRLRLTKTRRAVMELFLCFHAPLSVSKILRELEKNSMGVNKTTVYRELDKLVAIGLLERLQWQDRKQYYELAARNHHHHLICTVCNKITDVEVDESKILARAEELGRTIGFHITTHAVEFYGQCAACLKTLPFRQSV